MVQGAFGRILFGLSRKARYRYPEIAMAQTVAMAAQLSRRLFLCARSPVPVAFAGARTRNFGPYRHLSSIGFGRRCQSSAAGGGGDGQDPSSPMPPLNLDNYPTSWAEPEAHWDWSRREVLQDDNEKHAAELGTRNAEWRRQKLMEDPGFFDKIAKGQAPKYFWIGCCDSRVAPESLVNGQPGEIFVHRNIANQVIATDTNLRAALQYAIHSLEIEHIVVCGHYDCGGVRAATRNADHTAPLESWLTNIRDVYRDNYEELMAIPDVEERERRMVELNVIAQCLSLFKTNDVQKRRVYTAERPHKYKFTLPRIHAMVFSPADGILRRLPVDFEAKLKKYSKVYKLYDDSRALTSNVDPM